MSIPKGVVISSISRDGGVGKSTAAVMLAETLTLAGCSVHVLDTDHPQNSVYKWRYGERIVSTPDCEDPELLPRLPFEVSPVSFENSAQLKLSINQFKMGYDFVVLDTPNSFQRKPFEAALKYSDFALFPLKADKSSIHALEKLKSFYEDALEFKNETGKPTLHLIFFFNKIGKSTPDVLAAMAEIVQIGREMFPNAKFIDPEDRLGNWGFLRKACTNRSSLKVYERSSYKQYVKAEQTFTQIVQFIARCLEAQAAIDPVE